MNLYKAITKLETEKEAENFFRDLCTLEEIKNMEERWQIAQLLDKGEAYRKISSKLNVSTTTVTRVASWLNNGKGGYSLMLNRLGSHHNSSLIIKKS